MRSTSCALFIAVCCVASAADPPPVTVLVEFDQPPSELSFQVMQREASVVLAGSGLKLNFKLRSDSVTGDSYDDLVLMSFHGHCLMDSFPAAMDERGPYAFARTINGEVQPFAVVECDRVQKSVKKAMWGKDFKEGDALMGRALGRVVAHELYHILVKTEEHDHEGITRKALSGSALISDTMRFSPHDMEKLRAAHLSAN